MVLNEIVELVRGGDIDKAIGHGIGGESMIRAERNVMLDYRYFGISHDDFVSLGNGQKYGVAERVFLTIH